MSLTSVSIVYRCHGSDLKSFCRRRNFDIASRRPHHRLHGFGRTFVTSFVDGSSPQPNPRPSGQAHHRASPPSPGLRVAFDAVQSADGAATPRRPGVLGDGRRRRDGLVSLPCQLAGAMPGAANGAAQEQDTGDQNQGYAQR